MVPSTTEPPRRGGSLRYKVVLALTLLGALPVVTVSWLLSRDFRTTVHLLEAEYQEAVLAEASHQVLEGVRTIERDVLDVARALALAAARPAGEDGLEGVQAVLSTRDTLGKVRFQVPSARVSTVLSRKGATGEAPPEATAAQQKSADERGVLFTSTGGGRGLVVGAVPHLDQGARGYVTASVDLAPLEAELTRVAVRRFDEVTLVLADSERRAVARVGLPGRNVGDSVADLPIWSRLPDGTPWTAELGVVSEFDVDGTSHVGAVRTVSELGWALTSFRPRSVAYANLKKLERTALLLSVGVVLVALMSGLALSSAITRPILQLARQARAIGQRKYDSLDLPEQRGDEIGQLARSMRAMVQDLSESEETVRREAALRGDLSRFLSRELVDAIVRGEHDLGLGGRRAEVTVLFADVVGFTPLAEDRDPEQVVTLLNELFSLLSEIIFRHGGMVDKFIGDCVMAVWGATAPCPDQAMRALSAAEDMLRFLETANEDWRERFDLEVRLGIGVNSGAAIVGNVGSDKRMEYTVIGDVVNVAARLEAIARPNQLLVGEGTQRLAPDVLDLTDLGTQQLTGRAEKSRVFGFSLEG